MKTLNEIIVLLSRRLVNRNSLLNWVGAKPRVTAAVSRVCVHETSTGTVHRQDSITSDEAGLFTHPNTAAPRVAQCCELVARAARTGEGVTVVLR